MHTPLNVPVRLAGLPSALWRGYRHRRDVAAAVAAMRHLDDHTLRDIGIHPADIDAAVRGRPR